jgi:hypothetical protein
VIHPFTSSLFANPNLNSAFSSYGSKPHISRIVFSIGTKALSDDQYVIKNRDGSMPSASINNGLLTFSIQQYHPYIGIGDEVSLSNDITVYLNEKISLYQWRVLDAYGNSPPNFTNVTVVKIDKAFSSLYSAISGSEPEIYLKLGNNFDLISKRSQLCIACYKMTEDMAGNSITFSENWILDEECNIKIFSPVDISHECNSIQRSKIRGSSIDGFVLYSSDGSGSVPTIHMSPYISVSGLIIGDDDGLVGNMARYGFLYDSIYTEAELTMEIFDNVIVNVYNAIDLRTQPINSNIYNNIIKRCVFGIVVENLT